MARRLIFLLSILMLMLSGCFRQASEPVGRLEGSTAAAPQTVNSPVPPTDEQQATATTDGFEIAVTESTPIQAPTDVPPTEIPPTDEQPTLTEEAPTEIAPTTESGGASEPVPTEPAIATPQIFTPSSPGNSNALISPTPEPTNLPTPTGLPTTAPENCVYVVQPGDNLFRIAVNNNTTVDALKNANPSIPANNVIQPGERLILPDCTAEGSTTAPENPPPAEGGSSGDTVIHVVQSGETLLVIARRYGVTITDIVNANQLADPDRLSVGQELIIPNQ